MQILFILIRLIVSPANAAETASTIQSGISATASTGRLGNVCAQQTLQACVTAIAGSAINTVLAFTGLILLGYLLYAGFLWMTSGGEDDKAGEARTMIKNAVIGIVILSTAFAISSYVLGALNSIATAPGTTPTTTTTPAQQPAEGTSCPLPAPGTGQGVIRGGTCAPIT